MAEYSYVLENTRKTAKHSKVGSSLSTYVELCLFDIMGYCVCYLRASFTGKKKQFTLESPPTVQDSSQTRNRVNHRKTGDNLTLCYFSCHHHQPSLISHHPTFLVRMALSMYPLNSLIKIYHSQVVHQRLS